MANRSRFRLACSIKSYLSKPNKFIRPCLPLWLMITIDLKGIIFPLGFRSTIKAGHHYWHRIYLATPPWINRQQIMEMKLIYDDCPKGSNVDHIVPLTSALVSGLHVPWNLQHLSFKENMTKSNRWWPGHPFETRDLFNEN